MSYHYPGRLRYLGHNECIILSLFRSQGSDRTFIIRYGSQHWAAILNRQKLPVWGTSPRLIPISTWGPAGFREPGKTKPVVRYHWFVYSSLSTLCLILRLYTKVSIVKALGWDDVAIAVAWLSNLVFMALYLRSFEVGAGIHIWDIRIDAFSEYIKIVTISVLFATPANGLPKIAILLYYLRLNPAKGFRYSTIAALVLNAVWMLLSVCIVAFSCQPVEKTFNFFVPGKCLNLVPYFMVTVVANPILDLIVMIIPIPRIVHLHVNKQTKLILASIFFVGSCNIIISAETSTALNLAVVEHNLCVICGSVLVLRPFCRRHLPWLVGRTRPSEPVGASPGLHFDGPSGPRSRNHYRTKVSTIGGSSSNKTRKRGLWEGLGDTLFTNDDEEDFDSLRDTELDRVEGMGTVTTGDRHQRNGPDGAVDEGLAAERKRWNSYKELDSDGRSAETSISNAGNTQPAGQGNTGILKTVSLDVR